MALFGRKTQKEGTSAQGEKEFSGFSSNAFVRYWQLMWEKRWKLMNANLLYAAFSILPLAMVIALMYMLSSWMLAITGTDLETLLGADASFDTLLRIIVLAALITTINPLFAVGPVQAGFTYIIKSLVKGEPVFLWTDFSTKMRSNRKLGFITCIINGILTLLLLVDAVIYIAATNGEGSVFAQVPGILLFLVAAVVIFGFIVLSMMNMYIYPMMTIFNITLKQLYKNAFIFALLKWLPNLGILLLDFVIIGLPVILIPGRASFYLTAVLYVAVLPALVNYTNNYYVYPIIKKYMIDNPAADRSAGKAQGGYER